MSKLEKENQEKQEKPKELWLKLDYATNPGKKLAVELPHTFREATFKELVDYLCSDNAPISLEERNIVKGFHEYIAKPNSAVYTTTGKDDKGIQCRKLDSLDRKIKPYIAIDSLDVGKESTEIEFVDIRADHNIPY